MDFKEQLRQFVLNELVRQAGPQTLEDDESLLDRGIIDSLGLLRLLAYLESEYKVKVRDEDVIPEHFESINTIATFVASLSNGSGRR